MTVSTPLRRDSLALALVLGITLLGRLPFLGAGYGIDSDAWRVAAAAHSIRDTGQYGSSRVPGHPVQDIVDAGLIGFGPWGLNGATALLSCVAVLCFYRIARFHALPHAPVLALAFAFTPLVYVQSVNALDYLWALAFLLAAVDAFLRRRFLGAGVLLGLATGCRITSLAMLLPLLVGCPPADRRRAALIFGGTAIVVAALCYVPVLATYGPGYLRVTPTPYPRLAFILKELSLDVFGLVGLAGLVVVLAGELLARRRGSAAAPAPTPPARQLWLLSGVTATCFLAVFLKLPDDAAYLLPVVPFALLSLGAFLAPGRVLLLCACLIVSPFVLKVREVHRVGGAALSPVHVLLQPGIALDLPGAIYADHARRKSEAAFADATLALLPTLPRASAVVVADWYPILAIKSREHPQGGARVIQYPTGELLESAAAGNLALYYLPDVDRDVRGKTGLDLPARGARLLDPASKPSPAEN